jgi:hypothetical protein
MKTTKRIFLVTCLLALGFLLVAPSSAQQPAPVCAEVEFFPETRHNVCDQFLAFFQSRGGAEIFGYPITEQFFENGRLVQYFQRARMEHHPELLTAYRVQLGLLGDEFAPQDLKSRIDASEKPKSNDPYRRYFPETGHTVQYSFLEFFDEKGGLDIFGYPVTEFFDENGRTLQYFQRALMEWDPNRNAVVLHYLGEMWVDQEPQLRTLQGTTSQFSPSGEMVSGALAVGVLHASASVGDAVIKASADQTIWVYVNDHNGVPVPGAQVAFAMISPLGETEFELAPTDVMGHTQARFQVTGFGAGERVILDVEISYQGAKTNTRTNFFVWE